MRKIALYSVHDKKGLETREEQEPQILIDFQRNRLKRKKEFEKTCQIATLKKQYYKEKNCAQLFQKSLLLLASEPE